MSMSIITGMTGTAHVTAAQDGRRNAFIFGSERVVLSSGDNFNYTLVSNNLIRIGSGDLINQGRHICTEPNDYTELNIDNGITGSNRNDLIVARYNKSEDTGVETAELVLLKGTPASGTATDPAYITGNILTGEYTDEFPLYRICLTGLTVSAVERLFEVDEPIVNRLISTDDIESLFSEGA